MMKFPLLSGLVAAGLVCFGPLAFGEPDISIQVVTTFDVPGTGTSTFPFHINDRGEIVGYFIDASGATKGFFRAANGRLKLIVEPDDTGNFTRTLGINNSRVMCGDFFNVADNTYHGYFLSGSTFTQFDAAPGVGTYVGDINNVGDFVGAFGSAVQPTEAFIDVAGVLTSISVPGAAASYGQALNNADEMVGLYVDSGSVDHGFFRAANGTLMDPIDYPASISTFLNGVNDRDWVVGNYTDSSMVEHGLFLRLPHSFVSFDYPGAVATSLNGINKNGLICGSYTDSNGLHHGFIAQVTR
jgi:hypothetical protein